ncbi:hypothetical protein, partial [Altererythrobacter sp. MTPC7]|uniref:hypothetical protein n=1 Tax=Altererythrobacter sp. MTPC7 TaxID=3056567 RepID=UPI0036F3B418
TLLESLFFVTFRVRIDPEMAPITPEMISLPYCAKKFSNSTPVHKFEGDKATDVWKVNQARMSARN